MVKAQRATKEMEEGFRQECEELEAECLRLSDWERRLGDRIQAVASRAAEKRAQLERESDVQREKMRRVIDRETVVAWREKAAIQKELEVEQKEQAARVIIDGERAVASTHIVAAHAAALLQQIIITLCSRAWRCDVTTRRLPAPAARRYDAPPR
jgi:hypothetical protein